MPAKTTIPKTSVKQNVDNVVHDTANDKTDDDILENAKADETKDQQEEEALPMLLAYDEVFEHFDDYCDLFRGFGLKFLRVYSERFVEGGTARSYKHVTPQEVLHLAGWRDCVEGDAWLNSQDFPTIGDILVQIAHFRNIINERLVLSQKKGKTLPLETLREQFQLTELEHLLLIAVACAQLNDDIARIFQFATGQTASKLFSAIFFAELLAPDKGGIRAVLDCLKPGRALREFSLIELGQTEEWGAHTPLLRAPLTVPERILSFMMGEIGFTNLPHLKLHSEGLPLSKLILPKGMEESLKTQLAQSKPRLGLFGRRGMGRRTLLAALASAQNTSLIEISLTDIDVSENINKIREQFSLWFREARLLNAFLLFRLDAEPTHELETILFQLAPSVKQTLDAHIGAVCVTAQRATRLSRALFGELTTLLYPSPSVADQGALWLSALRAHLSEEDAKESAAHVAHGYCLSPGEIESTIQQTLTRRRGSALKDALAGHSLSETLLKSRGQELSGLAELRSTSLGLDEIVLSEESRAVLDEISNYARYSERVRHDWGFAKYAQGGGLSVLFSGPPGTGKTLTAGALAYELNRALYVVDISRVVDKYIGETEKRLGQIFDHAQESQAVLLFDEADSLFAKRTEVKSSNDRYANLEVNYLLQRLETYQGVSILTTNFASSLDEALSRRIQFKLYFPLPDARQRTELWMRLIPEHAPKERIDYTRLGNGFEMSGGHIKNAVFRACIDAAAKDEKLTSETLWDAAVCEYREMGHIIREGGAHGDDYWH